MTNLVDSNPFQPDVPEAIRRLDPDLYIYMQEQAEALRRAYAQIQKLNAALDSSLNGRIDTLTANQGVIVADLYSTLDGFKTTLTNMDGVTTLTRRLDKVEKNATYSLIAISQRIGKITEDSATIGEVEQIQAIANFYSLAGMAADDARNFAAKGVVTAQATARSERMARVYRDESSFNAETSQRESLTAQVAQLASDQSAKAAYTSETNAKASMDASGTSAEASKQSSLTAETHAAAAQSSAIIATNESARSKTSADNAFTSAEASRTDRLAAQAALIGSQSAASASQDSFQNAKAQADLAGGYANTTRGYRDESAASSASAATSAQASDVSKTQANAAAAEAYRQSTLSAQYSGEAKGYRDEAQSASNANLVAVNARIDSEIQVRASADAAATQRLDSQQSDFGGLVGTVTQQAITLADASGRASVYWGVVGQAGSNRASIELRATNQAGGYTGFDITGDVRINGNLLVLGSVGSTVIANSAVQKVVTQTLTYNISIPKG